MIFFNKPCTSAPFLYPFFNICNVLSVQHWSTTNKHDIMSTSGSAGQESIIIKKCMEWKSISGAGTTPVIPAFSRAMNTLVNSSKVDAQEIAHILSRLKNFQPRDACRLATLSEVQELKAQETLPDISVKPRVWMWRDSTEMDPDKSLLAALTKDLPWVDTSTSRPFDIKLFVENVNVLAFEIKSYTDAFTAWTRSKRLQQQTASMLDDCSMSHCRKVILLRSDSSQIVNARQNEWYKLPPGQIPRSFLEQLQSDALHSTGIRVIPVKGHLGQALCILSQIKHLIVHGSHYYRQVTASMHPCQSQRMTSQERVELAVNSFIADGYRARSSGKYRDFFTAVVRQIPGMGPQKAAAIVDKYKTLSKLVGAYDEVDSEEDKSLLIHDVRYGIVKHSKNGTVEDQERRIDSTTSESVYRYFCLEQDAPEKAKDGPKKKRKGEDTAEKSKRQIKKKNTCDKTEKPKNKNKDKSRDKAIKKTKRRKSSGV